MYGRTDYYLGVQMLDEHEFKNFNTDAMFNQLLSMLGWKLRHMTANGTYISENSSSNSSSSCFEVHRRISEV